ncbi:Na+/H+ antiporter subunit E [Botryobacter ruber]|uniref:Na+/H+ antiporter subunit E n=1 Tax=Botryobacter ruber TaxID=2171629 RepID=UPI000E0A1C6E|nr:Na+/H+ antiporter subunit E [Botryobacter ruber]
MKTFLLHIIIAFVAAYQFFLHLQVLPYNATTASGVFFTVFFLLWPTSLLYHPSYFRKLPKAINLFFFFVKEVLLANLKIAYDIITPNYIMRPAFLALPLTLKDDVGITLLACMISLTPGSLSVDLREDKGVLYVHTLYVKNNELEQMKKFIKHGFERRIIELIT